MDNYENNSNVEVVNVEVFVLPHADKQFSDRCHEMPEKDWYIQ